MERSSRYPQQAQEAKAVEWDKLPACQFLARSFMKPIPLTPITRKVFGFSYWVMYGDDLRLPIKIK